MDTSGLLLSLLATLFAVILVYFQYGYKQKITRDSMVFSFLRFVSLLGILLLLINPKVQRTSTEIHKPGLILAVDNSTSIGHLGLERQVRGLRRSFLEDPEIGKRFDLSSLRFGNVVSTDTLLQFDASQTNLYKIVQDANALSKDQVSPIVLITDGNQTYGNNFRYMSSGNPVFPIVVGDTVRRPDIQIDRINVNAYATLENNFPVEIFLTSSVNKEVRSTLVVKRKGIEMYRAPVVFTRDNRSRNISFLLPADSVGMQLYEVNVLPFKGELNVQNNRGAFGVEILNEQAEVAVVYRLLHPDLGMIKRSIETNKQRKAVLIQIDEFENSSKEFSLCILYQPDRTFESLISALRQKEQNLFIVSGSMTDWKYLNSAKLGFSKVVTGVVESVFPSYQHDFTTFYSEDLGYEYFPPLKSQLGEVSFNGQHEYLLTQKINGIDTKIPLLATFSEQHMKGILWFGEDIWKWRAHCYDAYGSFEKFDLFFNNLIQFLQLSDREKDLDLFYKPVFHADESVTIRAKKYDSNLREALNSKLVLRLKDSLKDIPFYLRNGTYEAQLNNMNEGAYNFEVHDLDLDLVKEGSFVVVPFSIEQEAQAPDVEGLKLLASNSGGALYYPDQIDAFKTELLENEQFRASEKERTQLISLVDWKWLLGLIVLSLSMEWLLRKYRGMI